MRCFVGVDDTDSSRGYCTTYLAFRIACDLNRTLAVLPYPRLVRLNPNIPFKTRGNAAVCLEVEAGDPDAAFEALVGKLGELSDVAGGANSGLVLCEGAPPRAMTDLYQEALHGVISPSRVRKLLAANGIRFATLGNGMGLVGAASSLGFSTSDDHTFELISYRRRGAWGSPREIDRASVVDMDASTFPHTFNNYDYQKRKVLVAPHGPDPVFAGVRGDTPSAVIRAFSQLRHGEELEGHMVYVSNQHTDAHLASELDWKVYSSGWARGTVESLETGPGGHVYLSLRQGTKRRPCAFYEPTGDLRRAAKKLAPGDSVVLAGGVRRPSSAHAKILNVEKMQVLAAPRRALAKGFYISSPRANRHLTKPLSRYGRESAGAPIDVVQGWLSGPRSPKALVRSR